MPSTATSDDPIKVITTNRKARFDYTILETFEAGIALQGTEVKSLRAGKANLKDSFARVDRGEIVLYNMHINPYDFGNRFNHDPLRPRKLLLRREEIRRLAGKVAERGLTLVPLRLYFKRGLAKVELALAKGKKLYDHREAIAERDVRREMERVLRGKE